LHFVLRKRAVVFTPNSNTSLALHDAVVGKSIQMDSTSNFSTFISSYSKMKTTDKPILLRYGGALKSSFKMNTSELNQAASSILRRAKEKAFYKGLPIYYIDNGRIIAEHADGRKVVVKTLSNASRTIRTSGT
jgi:hypothetical protein